jgi:hypothetical protein
MYDKQIHLRILIILFEIYVVTAIFGAQTTFCSPSCVSDELPVERADFHKLLEFNPNYFGNSPDSDQTPVFPKQDDTTYEQMISVGFNSILNVLEATVEIKLSNGYNGSLCTEGSWEYVRFYADYGSGWIDLGYSGINVHDIPNGLDCTKAPDHPLFFVATLPYTPVQTNCSNPLLPKILAILSWSVIPPPGDPTWIPVYGNVIRQHIQPPPANTTSSTLRTLMLKNQHKPYPKIPDKVVWSNPAKWSTDEDITPTIPRRPPFNTFFEQLISLGLDDSLNRLVATIRIKEPFGYDSNLCQNGSWEYISFWADWDDTCDWTYLGDLSINVHDIPHMPYHGLTYSAVLPVDLRNVSAPCNMTKIARVRASLSWNTPPPLPPNNPVRGNWLESHVLIPPYSTFPNNTQPTLYSIANVHVEDINITTGLTTPGALFVWNTPTDLYNRPCPFGYSPGSTQSPIMIAGLPVSGYVYRIAYTLLDSGIVSYLTTPITVSDQTNPPSFEKTISPLNNQGWFDYLPLINNMNMLLGEFIPPVQPATYQIQLQMATPGAFNIVGETPWYTILVNIPDPDGIVEFTNDPICGNFSIGATIGGPFWAYSSYFDIYSLSIVPSGANFITPANTIKVLEPTTPATVNTIEYARRMERNHERRNCLWVCRATCRR